MTDKNFWLYIEPYVYIFLTDKLVFLYNTLDGECIESANKEIIDLLQKLNESSNGVMLFKGKDLESNIFSDFILELRRKYIGDLIDISLTQSIPIQFTPILNLQEDIHRLENDAEKSLGEHLLSHLHELIFFIQSPYSVPSKYYPSTLLPKHEEKSIISQYLDIAYLEKLISQVPSVRTDLTINIFNQDLFEYEELEYITRILTNLSFQKKYSYYYNSAVTKKNLSLLSGKKITNIVYIDFPVQDEKLEILVDIHNHLNSNVEYIFLISSDEDYDKASYLINEFMLPKYSLCPIYTGSNLSFLTENMFLSREDILLKPVSMREIFINKSLNLENYGKLYILPNGGIYSNIFIPSLGVVKGKKLLELLYEELTNVRGWFKIRDSKPCSYCQFQWLCPPPSSYESLLDKNNLCHVK